MNWDNAKVYDKWPVAISNRGAKEELGRQIAEKVQDGQVIGVGSGSTAYLAVHSIAERVRRENLRISVICTSPELTLACAAVGLPVASLLQRRPDWAFDGADEVDPARNLIKGRGGAMFMEPDAFVAAELYPGGPIETGDEAGGEIPIPVEVLPVTLRLVEFELKAIGAVEIVMRLAVGKDGPVITENGNLILDVRFAEIHERLERDIKAVPGVIESGLFWGRDVEIVVAGN